MGYRLSTMNLVNRHKIIGVVRDSSQAVAEQRLEAYLDGGVRLIEMTSTTPGAFQIIEKYKEKYGDEIVIGTGTTLDPVTARLGFLAGADFASAPSFSRGVAEMCGLYNKVYMAGCFSSTEITEAMRCGVDIIKIYPCDAYPLNAVKVMMVMLNGANIIPAGDVSRESVRQWIDIGVFAVGLNTTTEDMELAREQTKAFLAAANIQP
ncbi:bifunctional 2-keto-4-hydroxyglutarate aldolase/2-keto-3-deoxy-6-phosphogluconate aldolase [Bacteroides sp. OttesenSCG-928-J23]|nr:bifunctional 2-keto-4-hydroxyglutarate aldolase/2-keto-3-deoxy-6-phosphogluconate aldolase [Bacteroides sp. OttesenSCG-928-J23]